MAWNVLSNEKCQIVNLLDFFGVKVKDSVISVNNLYFLRYNADYEIAEKIPAF